MMASVVSKRNESALQPNRIETLRERAHSQVIRRKGKRTLLAEPDDVLEESHRYALEILQLGLGKGFGAPDLRQSDLYRRYRRR
jgi:hypothetical protein